VLRERGSGTRAAFERHLEEQGHRLADFRIVAELGSTAAIKEAVRLGVGWSIVSDLALEAELAANLILTLPLEGATPWRREFYLVRDPRRSLSPTVAEFLAIAHGEEDHASPSPAAGEEG
jgi:DNA-binding transcriptional LysR family regulator